MIEIIYLREKDIIEPDVLLAEIDILEERSRAIRDVIRQKCISNPKNIRDLQVMYLNDANEELRELYRKALDKCGEIYWNE